MMGPLFNPWWVFVLLGFCAGILSGALGLGSGTILVPTLVLLFGFMQKSAQGNGFSSDGTNGIAWCISILEESAN